VKKKHPTNLSRAFAYAAKANLAELTRGLRPNKNLFGFYLQHMKTINLKKKIGVGEKKKKKKKDQSGIRTLT
jgi:hypothetical protein